MKKIFFLTLFLLLSFLACSQKNPKELKIATNSWIGYAPLFYAQEKGYLKTLNITLLPTVSLAESANLYDIAKADIVTTTQHEYYSLKQTGHDIIPIILLDRSNGGDMVLSNKTIAQLQKAKKIYTYLEIDSINSEILKEFMQHYKLHMQQMVFINKDQAKIEDLQNTNKKNILIVTYAPYNSKLEAKGFQEVASTRNMHTLFVIDALCTSQYTLKKYKKRLQKLKVLIDRSIAEIQKDKKNAYLLTKNYLGNISYEEFSHSLSLIKWINKPSKKLFTYIEPLGYKKEMLLK
jgi:NitT/TauT family transport system substrate-binding protein